MPAERFDFSNATDQELAALLDRPERPIRAGARWLRPLVEKAGSLLAKPPQIHKLGILADKLPG